MRKFSEVLEEYLSERDRQESDYYDNKFFNARLEGRYRLDDLTKEMDKMIHGVKE